MLPNLSGLMSSQHRFYLQENMRGLFVSAPLSNLRGTCTTCRMLPNFFHAGTLAGFHVSQQLNVFEDASDLSA